MKNRRECGKELICHTCVYGSGGHGVQGHCKAKSPIISTGMTNIVVCSQYHDILTAEYKPERPITDD